jgi:hypothetical protein
LSLVYLSHSPAALLYSDGFDSNAGFISSLPKKILLFLRLGGAAVHPPLHLPLRGAAVHPPLHLPLGGAAVYRCDKKPVFNDGFSR